MKISTVIILFLSAHLITAQLNFEGNPLTEHTDYLAEESRVSERIARQKNLEKSIKNPTGTSHVSPEESRQPGSPQKLYPVYSEDLGREVLVIHSGSKDDQNSELFQSTEVKQNSGSIQNAEPVQNSNQIQNTGSIQIIEQEPEKRPRQLQENFINTNAIQQEQSYQQQRINPADLALQMFLNSKSPKESEVALTYYLQGGQGLAEKLELEKQQQQKLRQEEQMRQEHIHLEQMRQKQIQEEQLRQQQIQQEQLRQQQIQQEQMRQKQLQQVQQEYLQQQSIQQQRIQPLNQMEQKHPNQDQFFKQQNLQPQIQQSQQLQIPNQPQSQQQVQLQNQQIQPQQPVDPLPQSLPQVPGAYSYPRIPFPQPRTDFYPGAPIYRWPMRRQNYRQPVPLQSRIGPAIYKGVPPPPMYPGKMIKPPVEVIYSRSPAYARGAPVVKAPPGQYEDASPWFPESDHEPPAKDVYYSQLYAQSYDPHYYNYIAKTGKIKPYLYGKLNPEENQGEGILAELFRGFKNHGIKNIMNPTFLLGMTIPALTFMLTALVQKRSLARSDSRSFDQEEIREYLERLQRALECHQKSRGAPTDGQCWQ